MNSKKWYASKTLWSNICIVVIASLTAVDGQFNLGIMQSPVIQAVLAVLAVFGIYGRATATTKIE